MRQSTNISRYILNYCIWLNASENSKVAHLKSYYMWYNVNSIYRRACLTDPLWLMLPNANAAITLANAKKDTWLDAINTYAEYKDATPYRTQYAKSLFIKPEKISKSTLKARWEQW